MHRAYGTPLDRDEWGGLKKAAKVDTRNGFVFAALSDDVPPLDEWLGGAGWMLDVITKLHPPAGMRVAGPPERYMVNGGLEDRGRELRRRRLPPADTARQHPGDRDDRGGCRAPVRSGVRTSSRTATPSSATHGPRQSGRSSPTGDTERSRDTASTSICPDSTTHRSSSPNINRPPSAPSSRT